ncbi:MAG: hypothetical protein M3Q19_03615 [Pseudomonadota bacterium]|nr:hypothetical protein [Pseudomonadota bacterium]
MLAFEVFIDGERLCVAGTDNWAVLSCILSGHRPNGDEQVDLSVGGLTDADAEGVFHHVRWGRRRQLELGTKIAINIVDAERPDEPTHRYRSDHEVQESPFTDEEIEEMDRAEWLRLKAKFEPDNAES